MSTTNIADQVFEKIKNNQVKIKSKYYILAEKIGLDGLFLISIISSAFLFNVVFYYLKSTHSLDFLALGNYGLLAFLENFPLMLTSIALIFLFLAAYLLRKYDISYKKPYRYLLLLLFVATLLTSIIFSYSHINKPLSQHPTFKPLYRNQIGLGHRRNKGHQHGLVGILDTSSPNQITLLNQPNLIILPPKNFDTSTLHHGDIIRAVGYYIDNHTFQALKIISSPRQ